MTKNIYRLASFNCKNVKRSIDSVRELCANCDVIALQETWLLPEEITYLNSIHSGFVCTGISAMETTSGIVRGRKYGGTAILWKRSIFQQVSVIQTKSARICAIKITTRDRPIIVISVYMPTNSVQNFPDFTDCLSQVSAIIDEYGVESVFMLGDFNATPGELFYDELIKYCNEQTWQCIDCDFLGVNSNTFTFISDVYGSCSWLDHCVVTQSAKRAVTNVYVKYNTTWSDHYPLIIEVNLNVFTPKLLYKSSSDIDKDVIWGTKSDELITVYNKQCHINLKSVHFPPECQNCGNYYCSDPHHKRAIDKLYADIVGALSEAAVASRGSARSGGGKQRVAGWNRHVREAHRTARSKFLEWVFCGRPRYGCIYDEMCESRRVFKSRLKWCQLHKEQLQMDMLAEKHSKGDFRGFWQYTSRMNVRPGLPVSVDGQSDPKSIAEMFRNHFTVQSPLGPASEVLSADLTGRPMESLIKTKEVSYIIKHMKRGKSPGHDGLSIEHLQHAGPHISRVLATLFSLCVSHSYLPDDLMKTVVVPIVKDKTGDLSDKNNYRPISLATIIAKVFDGLLGTQLDKYVKLHDNQFGFRPKLSTESAILCLKHTVKYYTNRSTPIYACFLDLSRAFDLVHYNILWNKIDSLDLPKEWSNIFKYWYSHQVNSVRWAGAMSESYKLECGVRQGGLTSPTLFNIYVNDLIVALSNSHVGCHIDNICVNNLSYADDMVLLSASIGGLRGLVRQCEQYAQVHGLLYNAIKSHYMVFPTGAQSPLAVPPVQLNGNNIDRVYEFKYLGHWITDDLRDHVDVERERRALSKRANMLARRFARCSLPVKITLFKAYCTSLYTCSLWADYTRASYNALRVQYNNAFRAVVGLPRFCSASGMFADARTDCFHTTMRKRCASLVRRVRASSNTVLAMIANRLDCPYITHCVNRHIKC